MKKMKYLLAVALVLCTTMSYAQFMNAGAGNSTTSSKSSLTSDMESWHGLRASYDRTFIDVDENDYEGIDAANGFSVSYVYAFKLSKKVPLFLETGLGVNFARGVYEDGEENDETSWDLKDEITMWGLSIPLNLVYGFKIGDNIALKPYTGFYLRANLSAKEKIKYTETYYDEEYSGSEKYDLFDKKDMGGKKNVWNRVQVGWQIGATFDIDRFNLGIGYGLDLNAIAKKPETKFSSFSVRLGFNF